MSKSVAHRSARHYDSLPIWGRDLDAANRYRVQRTLELIPGDVRSILDAGCGDGAVSNNLVRQGLTVVGVDISVAALQHFQGFPLAGSLDTLPFADRSFDLVLCTEVLEHLPESVFMAALADLERVAKRFILITTPNEEHLPLSFVRCEACGSIYHRNLHLRSFDYQKHSMLFQRFELVKSAGILTWQQLRLATAIEHGVLQTYKYRENLICPVCDHVGVERSEPRLLKRSLITGLRLADNLMTRRRPARWLASLYERAQVSTLEPERRLDRVVGEAVPEDHLLPKCEITSPRIKSTASPT